MFPSSPFSPKFSNEKTQDTVYCFLPNKHEFFLIWEMIGGKKLYLFDAKNSNLNMIYILATWQ